MALTKEQETRLNQDIVATQNLMLRNGGNHGLIHTLSGASPFIDQNKYESLYTNATEDMATYYKEFNTTNSFLTIGASGEQVANAINAGAKTISNYLNEEELMYWGTIYSMFGEKSLIGGHMIEKLLFTYKRLDEELVRKINPYLNPNNYERLKTLISSVTINYIDSDLYSLPKHIIEKSYDVINLSNIYEYLNYSNDVKFKHARKYKNFVMNELMPHLNENGTIMVSYLYAWNDELDKDFQEMYEKSKGKIVTTGALNMMDYFEYYLPGLTSQNLAYHYLFETFKDTGAIKIPTNHVQYGQSKDMSHDCALLLKK